MDNLTLFQLCDTDKGYFYSFVQRSRPVGLRDIIIVGDLITYNIGAFTKKNVFNYDCGGFQRKKKNIMSGRDKKNRCRVIKRIAASWTDPQ